MLKQKKVFIKNRTGLHARPASQIVQKAEKFSSEIKVIFKDKEVNAKSIMGLMSLGIGKGNEITVKAEGRDADEALKELVDFIEVELLKENQ